MTQTVTKNGLGASIYDTPTIAAVSIAPLLAHIRQYGIEPLRVLESCGLPLDVWRDPEGRLPLPTALALWERASQLVGDPILGIRTGLSMGASTCSSWFPDVSRGCTSVEVAADYCRDLLCSLSSATYCRTERVDDGLWFIKEPSLTTYRMHEGGRHFTECIVAAAYAFCRRVRASDSCRWTIYLSEAGPDVIAATRVVLGPVALRHRGHVVGFHVVNAPSSCDAARSDDPFLILARSRLESLIAEGRAPSVSLLAGSLAVSTRTLQRRLMELGACYSELVDEVRFARARELLESSSLDVSEIGHSLGFSDVVAFRRAFKRWTGTTPRRYPAPTSIAETGG